MIGSRLRDWLLRCTVRIVPNRAEFLVRCWAVISGRRVKILAADSAFWAVFSLPWMMLAIVALIDRISPFFGGKVVEQLQGDLVGAAEAVFSAETARGFAIPAINQLFTEGRTGLGLVGLLVAFYSGSRAVSSFLHSVTLVNGQRVERGIVRSRLIALGIYLLGIALIVLAIAAVTGGTDAVAETVHSPDLVFQILDPVVLMVLAMGLTLVMFHFAGDPTLRWRDEVLGAVLAVLGVGVIAAGLYLYFKYGFTANSLFSLLAAPIAILLFAYLASWVMLLGAIVNAVRCGREIESDDDKTRERLTRGLTDLASVRG